jgi:uncharacterized protein (DUF4213/DUF364 family)
MEGNRRILSDIVASIREDAEIREVGLGRLFSCVVSKFVGLSSTLGGCEEERERQMRYKAATALELSSLAFSEDTFEASLGLSAIKSLIEVDEAGLFDINASLLITKIGRDRRVTIIGHFPFVEKLKGMAKGLWVIERRPKEGDYPEEMMEESLPSSDLVCISGTTLINHTLERVLSLCRRDAFKILLGPSTPLSSVLFDYGIDVLSGILVTSEGRLLSLVREGANFRRIKREGVVRLVSLAKDRSALWRAL